MKLEEPVPPTIEWTGTSVRFLDQRKLPEETAFFEASTVDELCTAISELVVRGAPALGVTGAFGIALAAFRGEDVREAAARIIGTRPTAVNLRWGVERALESEDPETQAIQMAEEDVSRNRRLGAAGAELLADAPRVLTHCNTGSLACAGYGTALGVIRASSESGREHHVWVTETRPVQQGSRLTAWELSRLGITATVITDSAAASLMARGEVDSVIVGADRIAANGDVANKVGTYSLAVLVGDHDVPFYVAAPVSTVDLACPDGSHVVIEERCRDEIALSGTRRMVPEGVNVYNPAFDVTPSRLVTAIVTDEGVVRPPYRDSLAQVAGSTEGLRP